MNSYERKQAEYKETGRVERWLYVSELLEFLRQFPEDAWVITSELGHLNVHYDDGMKVATIDMFQNIIAWWDEDEQLD